MVGDFLEQVAKQNFFDIKLLKSILFHHQQIKVIY
jgi:hypothetical protein